MTGWLTHIPSFTPPFKITTSPSTIPAANSTMSGVTEQPSSVSKHIQQTGKVFSLRFKYFKEEKKKREGRKQCGTRAQAGKVCPGGGSCSSGRTRRLGFRPARLQNDPQSGDPGSPKSTFPSDRCRPTAARPPLKLDGCRTDAFSPRPAPLREARPSDSVLGGGSPAARGSRKEAAATEKRSGSAA